MMPDTEVISCPACRHVVRVPADWLGTAVQCPECQAKFTAPVRRDGRLTEPVLLSEPAKAGRPRSGGDPLFWLPAWGLMLVGAVGVAVNGFTLAVVAREPAAFAAQKRAEAEDLARRFGQDPAAAADSWFITPPGLAGAAGYGVACGLAAFAGGLAMATRRGYRVAQLGCVLAAVNLPALCCVPGAVFGLWGMLLLAGDEGRGHFRTPERGARAP